MKQRHLSYGSFCTAYDRAAAVVDAHLVGSAPSRAQLHRWTSGELTRLPYPDHCRVLEAMFPSWTAAQLFEPYPHEFAPAAEPEAGRTATQQIGVSSPAQFTDVSAIYVNRSEFMAHMPPGQLLDDATDVRACGLSLNLLSQHYPDRRIAELVDRGGSLRCLFLDPDGEAVRAREREEEYRDGHLSTLTAFNIDVLRKVRDQLTPDARQRLELAVYDETVRYNITIADDLAVVQPYLPHARGVESPTLVMRHDPCRRGLFQVFEQVFTSLWERGKPA